MKNEIRMALLCLAATSAPAFAQYSPQCGTSNFDQSKNMFTVTGSATGAVNQQCYITVYPAGNMPSEARMNPAGYLAEGTYAIDLSGGGGGGGGGGTKDTGGGGGGAGAAPVKSSSYLAPGVYKLTIGTGGQGGKGGGGRTESGNPTSLTNAATGALIAGFSGADRWTQQSRAAGSGQGGVALPGGATGGSGGDSGARSEETAQTGGTSSTPGVMGRAGQAGSESGRSDKNKVVQANAGGGGGASTGDGGAGQSAGSSKMAGDGQRGGHGYIKLAATSLTPAPVAAAAAPAPAYVAPIAAPAYVAPVVAAKKDRN